MCTIYEVFENISIGLYISRLIIVLTLAGIELFFFTMASMRAVLGHVLETLLITQACFLYCWSGFARSQGFFCSSPTEQQVGWGAQGLGEDTAGTADPDWSKEYSRLHGMVVLSTLSWVKKREEGNIGNVGVCLPKSPSCMMLPSSPGDGWTCTCPGQGVNEFLFILLVCDFCFTY